MEGNQGRSRGDADPGKGSNLSAIEQTLTSAVFERFSVNFLQRGFGGWVWGLFFLPFVLIFARWQAEISAGATRALWLLCLQRFCLIHRVGISSLLQMNTRAPAALALVERAFKVFLFLLMGMIAYFFV